MQVVYQNASIWYAGCIMSVPITAKISMVAQHAPMSAHSCTFAFCSVELRVLCGDGNGDCIL